MGVGIKVMKAADVRVGEVASNLTVRRVGASFVVIRARGGEDESLDARVGADTSKRPRRPVFTGAERGADLSRVRRRDATLRKVQRRCHVRHGIPDTDQRREHESIHRYL